jgi:glyoxylase-like metal-dependent hydrolase (beta-lactamase superfamily II)
VTLAIDELEPGVTRLRLSSWQGRLAGYEVSAYLLRDVLVDTGFPRGGRELAAALDLVRPRGVIVTHWHEDHAGNAPMLAERGLPIRMHATGEATLRARPAIRAYRHVVWGQTPRLIAPLVDFDPAPLAVVPLPGHTPDHIGVWDPERRILVSGDLFLGVKVRVAHRSESPRRLVESLRVAAALEPRLILDAHRGPVTDATAKLRAKIAWLDETIQAIAELGARGDPPRAIARRVLGREASVGYASFGEYSKLAFVRAVLREGATARP